MIVMMMVMVMIVIMMVMVIIVIMIMIMVIMIVVVLVVGVMSYIGGHDTRQADWVMGMVVAISLSRGRSREEGHCAEANYRGSGKNKSVIGHGVFPPKSSAATSFPRS